MEPEPPKVEPEVKPQAFNDPLHKLPLYDQWQYRWSMQDQVQRAHTLRNTF